MRIFLMVWGSVKSKKVKVRVNKTDKNKRKMNFKKWLKSLS